MSLKIRHVGITCYDLDRSRGFYENLGFRVQILVERSEPFIGEITGYPGAHVIVAMLEGCGMTLELIQYLKPKTGIMKSPETCYPGNVHLCFEGDNAMIGKLRMTALEVGSAEIPDGPQKGATVFYFRGPDGVTIEYFKAKE